MLKMLLMVLVLPLSSMFSANRRQVVAVVGGGGCGGDVFVVLSQPLSD